MSICLYTLINWSLRLYIYLACLAVCPFVSNKRQHIFCGTSRDPREGLLMIEFSKIASIQILFLKILKSMIFFYKIAIFVCFCFKMFTIEMEDASVLKA